MCAQFTGLYLCAPKQDMATAISMYFMSQQIGIAVGITLSSSLLKQEFHATLRKTLVNIPGYKKVRPSYTVTLFEERKEKNKSWPDLGIDYQEHLD